jgi:hypothetical protein
VDVVLTVVDVEFALEVVAVDVVEVFTVEVDEDEPLLPDWAPA